MNVHNTATRLSELNPLVDRYVTFYNCQRPHDALDELTLVEHLRKRRIDGAAPSHMQ